MTTSIRWSIEKGRDSPNSASCNKPWVRGEGRRGGEKEGRKGREGEEKGGEGERGGEKRWKGKEKRGRGKERRGEGKKRRLFTVNRNKSCIHIPEEGVCCAAAWTEHADQFF